MTGTHDDNVNDRDYIESENEDSSSSSKEQQVVIYGYVEYTFY